MVISMFSGSTRHVGVQVGRSCLQEDGTKKTGSESALDVTPVELEISDCGDGITSIVAV